MTPQGIADLESEIRRHQRLYYDLNTPEISDAAFDLLWEKLQLECPTSPVLSERSQYDADYPHIYPMGSLTKVKTGNELFERFAGKQVVITPKLDGASVTIHYENGRLVRAVSRGRTETQKGKVITANVLAIQGVPTVIDCRDHIEVRGEAVIYKEDFYGIMDQPGYDGLERGYANPRNAASGGLICKNPEETARRRLRFVAYKVVVHGSEGVFEHQELDLLSQNHFIVPQHTALFIDDIGRLAVCLLNMHDLRPNLPYDTDGIVVRLASSTLYNAAGFTGVCPNGAAAFKFENEQAKTTIRDVIWETGRLGYVTPVAVFDAVQLGGASVTRCVLHNPEWMRAHGSPSIGAEVMIEKCGDIIPGLASVIAAGTGNTNEPKVCPSCGSSLSYSMNAAGDAGKKLKCNDLKCPAQYSERVLNMLRVLEVKGIGPETVDNMIDAKLLKKPCDIFRLRPHDLVLAGCGDVEALNICNALTGVKASPAHLLAALGIEGWGRRMFETILKEGIDYNTFDFTQGCAELSEIAGVGVVRANTLVAAFVAGADEFLDDLEQCVTVIVPEVIAGKLTGKSFCLSGTLPKGKKAIQADIEALGGSVRDSVSKDLSYLVTGEGSGSKTDKAKKLGIQIITAESLYEMMKG